MKRGNREDMLSVLHRLFDTLPKTEIEFETTMWQITWHAKNKFIFEGKNPDPMFSVAKAKAVVDVYQKVRVKGQISQRSTEGRKVLEWTPPPIDWIKVNVDVAVHNDQQVV